MRWPPSGDGKPLRMFAIELKSMFAPSPSLQTVGLRIVGLDGTSHTRVVQDWCTDSPVRLRVVGRCRHSILSHLWERREDSSVGIGQERAGVAILTVEVPDDSTSDQAWNGHDLD